MSAAVAAPTTRPARRLSDRRAWLGAAGALLACGWGGNGFTPLVSLYEHDLDLSAQGAAALFAIYVAGLVPGFLIGGGLSDRFGRRVAIWAVLLTGVASLLLAIGSLWIPLVFVGRFVVGLGLGACMSIASTWVKELSSPPFADDVPGPAAARRAAFALTAGFGLGPTVAGIEAQWGPLPLVVPYVIHIAVVVAAVALLLRTPETRAARSGAREERVPVFADAALFRGTVLFSAPWIFGGMAIAFIIMPTLLADRLGDAVVGFSTLLTLVALVTGLLVQPATRRTLAAGSGRGYAISLSLLLTGLGLAVLTVTTGWVPLAVLVAMVLGASYGVSMVTNLYQTQRAASPRHLGTATAVFYSISYLGFLLPSAFGALTGMPDWLLLTGTLGLALACAILVAIGRGGRRG